MKMRNTRPAASFVGRLRRQDDALLHRRRRRGLHVVHAPAMGQDERDDFLLDAVLVDLELSGLQVCDELIAALVADDDIGGHEIDADAECWLRRCLHRCRWCRGLGRLLRLSRRDRCLSRIPRRRDDCEHADDQELSEISHGKSILRRASFDDVARDSAGVVCDTHANRSRRRSCRI